jgi:hypothetical protein
LNGGLDGLNRMERGIYHSTQEQAMDDESNSIQPDLLFPDFNANDRSPRSRSRIP